MALDLRVKTHDPFFDRIGAVVEQAITPETRGPREADAFFSDAFVRRHTDYESLAAFCRDAPCVGDSIGCVERLPPGERDEFVAANTDFETWGEMRRTAATSDLIALTTG